MIELLQDPIPLQTVRLGLLALTNIAGLVLVATGLAVIFGLMGVINLSHGALMMTGAYVAFITQDIGLSPWLGVMLAPIVVGIVGVIIEFSVIKRLYSRPLDTLLATWGVAIILREGVNVVFGTDSKSVEAVLSGNVQLLGVTYPLYWLLIIFMAALVLTASVAVFKYTDIGIMALAVIEDRQMAAASGVNTVLSDRLTFGFGAALAGLSGAVMAPLLSVNANMGIQWLLNSFLVVIVGGVGSFIGTAVGGVLIGGLDNTLRALTQYTALAQAFVLLIAFIILRYRPNGLIPADRGAR
ncbi:branched-chain amino acid ABC transporter permease [Haloquadratum walsbyi]|uniref:ABC-type transport system permease protein n=1 Tax=Haloquadratum walsbyi (strain DSM 16854 / JCM 12705 / C23) TaxID=768065 RepID=G0LJJ3_HALWC|nr:branched-chain amino acid ABC transporter permease [Haloquadratum walsbyi]CCC40927.1 ABC-type transport system permease protein [Haloquadratum walsbyi C23]